MPTDKQALAALDDIDRMLHERLERPAPSVAEVAIPTDELVGEYWRVRARLDTALTLIDKIPVYGNRIGTAFRFLMQICDRTAPQDQNSTDAATTAAGAKSADNEAIVYGQSGHGAHIQRRGARGVPPSTDPRPGLFGLI